VEVAGKTPRQIDAPPLLRLEEQFDSQIEMFQKCDVLDAAGFPAKNDAIPPTYEQVLGSFSAEELEEAAQFRKPLLLLMPDMDLESLLGVMSRVFGGDFKLRPEFLDKDLGHEGIRGWRATIVEGASPMHHYSDDNPDSWIQSRFGKRNERKGVLKGMDRMKYLMFHLGNRLNRRSDREGRGQMTILDEDCGINRLVYAEGGYINWSPISAGETWPGAVFRDSVGGDSVINNWFMPGSKKPDSPDMEMDDVLEKLDLPGQHARRIEFLEKLDFLKEEAAPPPTSEEAISLFSSDELRIAASFEKPVFLIVPECPLIDKIKSIIDAQTEDGDFTMSSLFLEKELEATIMDPVQGWRVYIVEGVRTPPDVPGDDSGRYIDNRINRKRFHSYPDEKGMTHDIYTMLAAACCQGKYQIDRDSYTVMDGEFDDPTIHWLSRAGMGTQKFGFSQFGFNIFEDVCFRRVVGGHLFGEG
jgi:hypothetical protein